MRVLPAPDDRGVVVFWLWPSFGYDLRFGAAFLLVVAGLVVQFATASFIPGVALVAGGTALLLVRGYDNRVDFGSLRHEEAWEPVEMDRLASLQALDERIRSWDRSALDVTNPIGATVGAVLVVALGLGAIVFGGDARILVLDALVLVVQIGRAHV